MKRNHLFFVLSMVVLFASCSKEEVAPIAADQPDLSETLESRTSNAVGFKIGKANANPGDEVCLDVSVKKFTDILGIQYSLAWDADVLTFSQVNNFNLPGLSGTSFGSPSSDRLTISWIDQGLSGVTLGNNTTIYSVCFTVVGDPGDETDVEFNGDPTSIEVIDSDLNILNTSFKAGRVKVK